MSYPDDLIGYYWKDNQLWELYWLDHITYVEMLEPAHNCPIYEVHMRSLGMYTFNGVWKKLMISATPKEFRAALLLLGITP